MASRSAKHTHASENMQAGNETHIPCEYYTGLLSKDMHVIQHSCTTSASMSQYSSSSTNRTALNEMPDIPAVSPISSWARKLLAYQLVISATTYSIDKRSLPSLKHRELEDPVRKAIVVL
jgi:hypothetical protein